MENINFRAAELVELVLFALTIVSVVIAAFTFSRHRDRDQAQNTERIVRIDSRTESTQNDVMDIKDDIHDLKRGQSMISERIAIAERDIKAAHKRIDRIEGKEEVR